MKLKVTYTALVEVTIDEDLREEFELNDSDTEEEVLLERLRDSCSTLEELSIYISDGPFNCLSDNIELKKLSPAEADALFKELP